MDYILIEDLLARCIIGVNEEERRNKQDVVISVAMGTRAEFMSLISRPRSSAL